MKTTTRAARLFAAVAAGLLLSACQSGGGNAINPGPRPGSRPIPSVQSSGEAAYYAHEYQKACDEFAEVIHRDPGSSKARYWLGMSLLGMEKPAEAREQLEVALAADVENEKIFSALCRALYEDKKLDDLFRLLHQRTGEHGSVQDYLTLADYCRKTGDMDESHTALLTAARLDKGEHVEPQLALADFYQAIDNQPEMSRRLRMAYFIDPSNSEVQQRLTKFGHHLGPGLALKPIERS